MAKPARVPPTECQSMQPTKHSAEQFTPHSKPIQADSRITYYE